MSIFQRVQMTKTSSANPPWLTAAILIGVIGIVMIAAAFPAIVSPLDAVPTATVWQPTLTPTTMANSYQPEILPPPYTPLPTRTSTPLPTHTHLPTRTPFILPTLAFDSSLLLLPDLTVSAISEPLCVPERSGTIIEFYIFIRNIGHAGTRYFGSFRVDVFLLLGQQRYRLDEWASQFNGVVGVSNLEIASLGADEDVKLTAVLDLKGNKTFGVEAIVNAGDDPMREEDMTNNTLTKYFSAACY